MTKAICLIGPPGSGKSTYRNNINAVAISSDDFIDAVALEQGKTYNEVFETVDIKEIEKIMRDKMIAAIKDGNDIIIDRTNMSRKSRNKFMCHVPKNYTKIAVVFEIERSLLDQRLQEREINTGKSIPDFVVDAMIRNFELPSYDDFDEIIFINQCDI